jgi:hypothetical protein
LTVRGGHLIGSGTKEKLRATRPATLPSFLVARVETGLQSNSRLPIPRLINFDNRFPPILVSGGTSLETPFQLIPHSTQVGISHG